MAQRFLDATMEVRPSHDEGENRVYEVILAFKDLHGRDRKHISTIEFPRSLGLQTRVSFTALSSVNPRMGLVAEISDLAIRVMLPGEIVTVPNTHDFGFSRGDQVCVVERLQADEHQLRDVVVPAQMSCTLETLCLQSVNADILDGAENLLYRLAADPFIGGVYASRVAT